MLVEEIAFTVTPEIPKKKNEIKGCLEENNGEISRTLSCSLSLSKGVEGKAKGIAAIRTYSLRENLQKNIYQPKNIQY